MRPYEAPQIMCSEEVLNDTVFSAVASSITSSMTSSSCASSCSCSALEPAVV